MQSTAERRQSILEALCDRRYDTVVNLATEFGVSDRTIRNDILVLSCSYPVYTVQGNGGGVFVTEGFRLGRKYLSETQKELLSRLASSLSGNDATVVRSILKDFTPSIKKEKCKCPR